MARHTKFGWWKDQQSAVINAETLTVTLTGTTTVAIIYTAEVGGSVITNGVITLSSVGFFQFWVDEADYATTQKFRLTFTGAKFKTLILDDIVIFPGITTTSTDTFTNKTIDADNNTISNLEHGAEVDNPTSGVHGVTGTVVGTTDTQTLSAKTLTSPVINTQISGTAFLDEDDMASDSAVKISSQQAIKKYVDNHIPEYRHGMNCKQASSTTITVEGDSVIVDGTIVTKTSNTTLTLTTDADWIGGSSLQAVSTSGYIYVDASGNILMHTTAPDESDTAGNTVVPLRYNDFAGATDYRMLGWFYMNATGAGELNAYEVGNLKDGNVQNKVRREDTTGDTINDNSYASDLTGTEVHFYCSGKSVNFRVHVSGDTSATADCGLILDDGAQIAATESEIQHPSSASHSYLKAENDEVYAQGMRTFKAQAKVSGNSWVKAFSVVVIEET